MEKIREIYDAIKAINTPQESQYTLVKIETDGTEIFYGKDSDGNPVFSVISHNAQLRPTIQKTKKLIFWFIAGKNKKP
jgi:hypothetical protein